MSMEQLSRPVSSDSGSLPEKLDDAIGEASTGIGVMLSELVRRSLKGGVANIDQTLKAFAETQVDSAVEQQMPQFAETASTVAESTSARLISEQVTPTVDHLTGEVRAFEGKLLSETERLDQQFNETTAETKRRLAETAAEAERRLNETSEHLGSLKENARSKWKRLVAELDAIGAANAHLKQQVLELQSQLSNESKRHQQLIYEMKTEAADQIRLLQQNGEQLSARLAELEKPKGLKAMWQKVRGRNAGPAESAEE